MLVGLDFDCERFRSNKENALLRGAGPPPLPMEGPDGDGVCVLDRAGPGETEDPREGVGATSTPLVEDARSKDDGLGDDWILLGTWSDEGRGRVRLVEGGA